MDKKYLIERTKLEEERLTLNKITNELHKFLREKQFCFDEAESIEALKRIKEYLIKIEERRNKNQKEFFENNKKILESCNHEILIKEAYYQNWYYCPICKKSFDKTKIDFSCFLIEPRDSKQNTHIINIIYEICDDNENIFDVFEKQIENERIKIYRRTR